MVKIDRVLVVGGGIGGMSAAIALAQAGYAVELVEADPEWRVLGAGLTVLGSTLRALSHLGVLEEVERQGYFARGNDIYSFKGNLLFQRPGMRMPDAPDLPSGGGILRPVLHTILSQRVKQENITVRLGLHHTHLEEKGDAVRVTFSDGSEGRYGLIIAADGVQSSVRRQLFPDAPVPTFTGQGCWRLVVDRPADIVRSSFYVGGPVTVGVVPVSQQQMYVWVLEHVPDNPWVDPTTQHEQVRELLKDFGGGVAKIRDDLNPASIIVYRPLEAVLMPSPWCLGRVLLTGDAAHATTPHLASGAGLAIEDGVVIAQELCRAETVEEALAAFMERRFDRCRLVVENSIEIGRVEMAHQPDRINEIMNVSQEAIAQPF
ncbi:FAD-dependent monooxygenase [Flavisphingomonas formosensis]|uniref:FAD-dependent monooxygenase n=1 Tax=Flavisphingomonas formosensis TaxID=861534 RepID=UPI001E2EE4CE|nr:FAD-dependent monooxygenase [Sphingomonas formosensis]